MGLLMAVLNLLFTDDSSASGPSRSTGKRQKENRPTSRHLGIIEIQRNSVPLHQERGWRQKGDELVGYFRTRRTAVRGRIAKPFSRSPEFFVIDPPSELLNGEHSACFSKRRKGVYAIHFNDKPVDVTAGIMSVENTIQEAFQ